MAAAKVVAIAKKKEAIEPKRMKSDSAPRNSLASWKTLRAKLKNSFVSELVEKRRKLNLVVKSTSNGLMVKALARLRIEWKEMMRRMRKDMSFPFLRKIFDESKRMCTKSTRGNRKLVSILNCTKGEIVVCFYGNKI